MTQNSRPYVQVIVDEHSAFGEAFAAVVEHRTSCRTCGTTGTGGVNRRLCVAGDRFLQRAQAQWVVQGHHHNYRWMVTDAV
ncbi:MAG: hypothetical protein ACRDUW_10850 [Pseudonocardiaceae bacterium]